MHLNEEQLQRLLHDELAWTEVSRVREHVTQCADCRDRLGVSQRDENEVGELLRHLDHPPPRVTATALIARARSRDWSWMRRAAVMLLVVSVAGVAWAAPGSPVPAFLGRAFEWIRRGQNPSAPRSPAPVSPAVAGLAVAPGPSLVILFTSAQAGSAAHVSLADGQDVVVRAPVGAAVFTSGDDRLVIDNKGPQATFEIEIPRTAARVEVRVDGHRIYLKDGPRVTAPTPAETGGRYVIPLRVR